MSKYVINKYKGVAMQEIVDSLEKLRVRDGGIYTKSVVAEARDITSVLHPCFEWDDSVAAELHREAQARGLISNVQITVESKPVRVYHNVTVERQVYEKREVIISDKLLMTNLIEQVSRDFSRISQKMEQVKNMVRETNEPDRMEKVLLAVKASEEFRNSVNGIM